MVEKTLICKAFQSKKNRKKISLQFDDIFSQNEEIANFYLRKIMKKNVKLCLHFIYFYEIIF